MRTPLALCALALVVSLAGCSTESEMRATDPAASDPAASDAAGSGNVPPVQPSTVPAADGQVATQGLVTVLDDGDGPELCLGGVAESLPPQCGGPKITGWDWAEHEMHEEQAGVKWGDFHLTGTFDGTTFAVSEAIPAALYDAVAEPDEEPLGTPCAEPEGGWVVDATKTDPEAMDATLTAAAALPGYAMAWLDGQIINVAVTEDLPGAEATLRETWGGGLCVSEAEHTEDKMQAIQAELNALPGVLSTGSRRPDHLEVHVVMDDGSIERWIHDAYGEDMVTVTSALVPVGG